MQFEEVGCTYGNQYFADLLGISPQRITDILGTLLNLCIITRTTNSLNQRLLLYNTDTNNIIIQYCTDNGINTKKKERNLNNCLNNTSTLNDNHLDVLKKEKKAKDFEFNEFWFSYPKQGRINKTRCQTLYWQARERGVAAAALHNALECWKQGQRWKEGFICHLQKWLNQEYYNNPPEPYNDYFTRKAW